MNSHEKKITAAYTIGGIAVGALAVYGYQKYAAQAATPPVQPASGLMPSRPPYGVPGNSDFINLRKRWCQLALAALGLNCAMWSTASNNKRWIDVDKLISQNIYLTDAAGNVAPYDMFCSLRDYCAGNTLLTSYAA